ncbi:MAG: hypothetical protein LBL59_06650 [Xanthomonadaceae bacterium]|jgi:hypothetical protein|nr:hypothetical protein [Xanthomonadaceae bacterium]
MPTLPLPPVPQRLREMLKDYPKHLDRLQEVLNQSVQESMKGELIPFDMAIWALEDELGSFIDEARSELRAAEASGDVVAITAAEAKENLMSRAIWKHRWLGDAEFRGYFEKNQGAFK